MFFFKKQVENDPQRSLKPILERIERLENSVSEVKSAYLEVLMDQKQLRDKVLRKIQYKSEEQTEEKPADKLPKTQYLNTFNPFG